MPKIVQTSYYTTVLILHVCKIVLEILQSRPQQYVNQELPDVHVEFRKGKEPEIRVPTFIRSWRKQGSSRKMTTSASLPTLKPLNVWIATNCENS